MNRLEWSPDTIKRFWNYLASRPGSHGPYFSFQVGLGVTNILASALELQGKEVLDYGCGPGYLIEHLLEAGAIVTGADYSPATVDEANKRFASHPRWRGALLVDALDETRLGSFDAVTCLETIEHVLPEDQPAFLEKLSSLLKKGGLLLLTTPNEEDLESSFIGCPACDTEYHRMQHVSAFSAKSLGEELQAHGFTVLFCGGLNLWNFQWCRPRLRRTTVDDLTRVAAMKGLAAADRVHPKPFPHNRLFRYLANAHENGSPHLIAVARRDASKR